MCKRGKMENTDKIFKEIARKNKEIEAKEADITRLQGEIRDLRTFVDGMSQTLKLLNKSPTKQSSSAKPFVLRPGSDMSKVRTILLPIDSPLHIDEILKHLGKGGDAKAKASLAGSMNTYAADKKVFVKTAPNTFGLIEKSYSEDFDDLTA